MNRTGAAVASGLVGVSTAVVAIPLAAVGATIALPFAIVAGAGYAADKCGRFTWKNICRLPVIKKLEKKARNKKRQKMIEKVVPTVILIKQQSDSCQS